MLPSAGNCRRCIGGQKFIYYLDASRVKTNTPQPEPGPGRAMLLPLCIRIESNQNKSIDRLQRRWEQATGGRRVCLPIQRGSAMREGGVQRRIDPRGGLEEKGAYKGRLVGRELNVEVFFFLFPLFLLDGYVVRTILECARNGTCFFSNCRDKW